MRAVVVQHDPQAVVVVELLGQRTERLDGGLQFRLVADIGLPAPAVLVELADSGTADDCELVASWTDRDGEAHTQRVTVELPAEPETFGHDGVRKAVALARYAGTLRNWARAVRRGEAASTAVDDWLLPDDRGEHERESVPLAVPDGWADRFDAIRASLAETKAVVRDDDLRQELDLLDELCAAAESGPERGTEVTD